MTVIHTMKKINRRVSGSIPPLPKSEIDGKITDLSLKTIPQLLELRERQLKLLNNKSFLSRLPDKGAKIIELYDKINTALKTKQEEEQTCQLLGNLNINYVNKESIHDIEWKGNIDNSKKTYLDSDDDSDPEDVLQILSQRTAEKKKIVLKPEQPLIKPTDLETIGETSHIRYIVNKTESNVNTKPIEQFKPYKTTKSNVHDPEKEILRKKHKNWEVTAATPPPSVHGPAKILNLQESLILQKDYNVHLKEIEAQHAAKRLLVNSNIKMDELPEDILKFGDYRNADSDHSDVSDAEGSDKEVHDEEPEKGGVIFTIMK